MSHATGAASSSSSPSPSSPTSSFASASSPSPPVVPRVRACNCCREAHSACDATRPCRRCVRTGRAHLCSDIPPRKRGRRPKVGTASASSSTLVSLHPTPITTTMPEAPTFSFQSPLLSPSPPSTTSSPSAPPPPPHHLQPPWRHEVQHLPPDHLPPHDPYHHLHHQQHPLDQHPQADVEDYGDVHTSDGDDGDDENDGDDNGEDEDDMELAEGSGGERVLRRLVRIVETLMGEVRGLKRNNEQLHRDLEALQIQQQAADHRVAQLLSATPTASDDDHDGYADGHGAEPRRKRPCSPTVVPLPSSPSSSSSAWRDDDSDSSSSSSSAGSSSPRSEARRRIVFVARYPRPSNFAIPDFKYPVMGCTFESVYGSRPPTVVFANTAFAQLTEYPLDQLLGAPITKVRVTGGHSHKHMWEHLVNKAPMSVSPVFEINCLVRCRSGRLLRTEDKTQFFFDQQGNAKHAILCLLSWQEGTLRDDEVLDRWLPIAPGPEQ